MIFIIYSSYKKLYHEEKVRHSVSILYQSNATKIGKLLFTYTLLTFLLDYGKMDLLKTHEVFFIGLATMTAVKKTKKHSIMKNIMIRNNRRN